MKKVEIAFMRVDNLLRRGFTTIIEVHPLKSQPQGNGYKTYGTSSPQDIVEKATYLQKYADIITITQSASPQYSHTSVQTAQKIKERGVKLVMPHLTLKNHTPGTVATLTKACLSSGINNLFIVRGDDHTPKDSGFRYSSDLIQHLSEANPNLSIGAACNPYAPVKNELLSISSKVNAGATYLITQPLFSVDHYLSYCDWVRENGITVPIIAGVLPLKTKKSFEFVKKFIPEITIPEDVRALHYSAQDIGDTCVTFTRELISDLKKAGAPGLDLFSRGDVALSEKILRPSIQKVLAPYPIAQ